MFTDAIFAIAITLLVIEIRRPAGDELASAASLWRFLGRESGSLVAFVVAFVMLWFVWRAHHRLFDQVERLSQRVLLLHIPLLLFAAFLPYSSSVFGKAAGNPLAICLFAGTEAVLLLCQAALVGVALRQRILQPDADLARLSTTALVNLAIGGFWAVTAALAFWVPGTVPLLWLATPVVTVSSARLARRLRRP